MSSKVASTSSIDGIFRGDSPNAGYIYAGLNAIISGFAIYINSLGVKVFADSALYTTLKNAVVGVALLVPLVLFAERRSEWRRLTGKQWGLLLLLAVIGGSVPYVLFFRGLQLTTPVTGALLNHAQFVLVAVLAALLLAERVGLIAWLALPVLFIGTTLGANLHTLHWNTGAWLVAASSVLFAAGVVLAKYLLRDLSTTLVMTAKMSLGSLLLIAYVGVTGHLKGVDSLTMDQWAYAIATGLILLAFTVTAFLALRSASATATTAIPAAAPIITALCVAVASQKIALTEVSAAGLALLLVAALAIGTLGRRRELRRWHSADALREKAAIA
jgi:drug/metabolite transporter (DMT)-like permease